MYTRTQKKEAILCYLLLGWNVDTPIKVRAKTLLKDASKYTRGKMSWGDFYGDSMKALDGIRIGELNELVVEVYGDVL